MGASVSINRDRQEFEESELMIEQERQINIGSVQSIRCPRSEKYFDSLDETEDNEQIVDSNVISRQRIGKRIKFELTITLKSGTDKRQILHEVRTLLGERGNLIYDESLVTNESKSKTWSQYRNEQLQSNSVNNNSITQRESDLSQQLHQVITQDQLLYHAKRGSETNRFSSQVSGNMLSDLEQMRINFEKGLMPQTSIQSHLNIMESPKFFGDDFDAPSPLRIGQGTRSFSPIKMKPSVSVQSWLQVEPNKLS